MTERNPRRWLILVILCLALLTVVIDTTILNVAIPSLTRELGAGTADLQWILNGYTLVLAGTLLAAGALADRYGQKRALLGGLVAFGLSSVLAATADTTEVVIAARVAMGLGAAFMMPSTLAVLARTFDDEERLKAIGIWMAVSSVGIAGGPILGGLLLTHFWWGSVFLVNVPVVIVALAGIVAMVPESRNPHGESPDLVGALLSCVAMVALAWAIISVPGHGWTSGRVGGAALLSGVAFVCFGLWERRTRFPMLDVTLFAERGFTGAVLGGLLAAFGIGGSLFLLTQHLQFVLDYSPLEAAVRIVPFAVAMLVGSSVLSAQVGRRLGAGPTVAVSLGVGAAGLAVIALAGTSGYAPIVPGLVLVGAGVGMAGPIAGNALLSAIPRERAGTASGVNGTLQEFGSGLGVAVLGSVLTARFAAALPDGLDPRSLPEALAGAGRRPDAAGLQARVETAFADAIADSQLLGAAAVLVGGLLAGLLLWWSRPRDVAAGPQSAAPQQRPDVSDQRVDR